MHSVGVLVLNGVVPFDLGVACDTFARVRVPNVDAPYRVRVCGERRCARGDLFDVRTAFGLDGLRDADTVVVPGVAKTNKKAY